MVSLFFVGPLSPMASLRARSNPPRSLTPAQEAANLSAGLTAPHPNFGCMIARGTDVVAQGFIYAQGTKCAELQAVEADGELARGATAFLNLEPGDCYGDLTPGAH